MEDKLAQLGRAFWQFEIGGVPLPHLKARGAVGEIEGEWRLKVWGERLLFCAVNAPERVFAVVTPCESEADLVAFWRAAVEREKYGRLTMERPQMNDPNGSTSFLLLAAKDGVTWIREWCGDTWLPFKNDLPEGMSAMGRTLRKLLLSSSKYDMMSRLWQRPFDKREEMDQTAAWLRGSSIEWKQVLQSCALIHYGKTPTNRLNSKIKPGSYAYFARAHTPFAQGSLDGVQDYRHWFVPLNWEPLFDANFQLVGWHWERYEGIDEDVRSTWHIEPASVACEIQLTLAPSHHQILEAQLFLRDWLRGKVPDEQIAALLE